MPFLRLIALMLLVPSAILPGYAWSGPRPRKAIRKHANASTGMPPSAVEQANRLVMVKHTHLLTLYAGERVLGTYYAMTGRVQGPKQSAGDLRTPEGTYFIDARKTVSCCHLALHLSYPSEADKARAAAAHEEPGINIEIHGLPRRPPAAFDPAHPVVLGTHGCIEVSNEDMDKIFAAVKLGTPITIEP